MSMSDSNSRTTIAENGSRENDNNGHGGFNDQPQPATMVGGMKLLWKSPDGKQLTRKQAEANALMM